MRDLVHRFLHRVRKHPAGRLYKTAHRFCCALTYPHGRLRIACVQIDAAHPRLRSERNESRVQLVHFARTQPERFLRQHDNAAPLGRFVGKGTQLGRSGKIVRLNAGCRMKRDCHPISERDRASLIEE